MMNKLKCSMALAASVLQGVLLLEAAPTASAAPFKIVVSTGDVVDGRTLTSIGTRPDLNNAGQIVYTANHAGGQSIFRSFEEVVAQGQVVGTQTFGYSYGGLPVINNNGTIGFSFRNPSGFGGTFYATTAGAFSDGDFDGTRLTSVGNLAINDSDRLAIVTSVFEDGESKSKLAVLPDELLLDLGGSIPRHGFNNAGDYVYRSGSELHISGEVEIAANTVIDGRNIRLINEAFAINNAGVALFTGVVGNSVELFTTDRHVAAPGSVFGGKTVHRFGFSMFDLNDHGRVGWYAEFTDGSDGVLIDDELVLTTGQLIDGKTITAINSAVAINELGQIVVRATFSDGTVGLISNIPEPSAVSLLVLPAAGLARRRR